MLLMVKSHDATVIGFPLVHPLHPSTGDVVRDIHSAAPVDMMVTKVDERGGGVVCDWTLGETAQQVWFPLSALSVVRRADR